MRRRIAFLILLFCVSLAGCAEVQVTTGPATSAVAGGSRGPAPTSSARVAPSTGGADASPAPSGTSIAPRPKFDNATTAGWYSALTGLLAGFSFAGLVLIITQRLEGKDVASHTHAQERALSLLLVSFLGLTVTSLSYAVVSGEKVHDIAAVEHVVAGTGFMVSSLVLLLAVQELLRSVADRIRHLTYLLIGIATPLLGYAYVVAGVLDATQRGGDRLWLLFPSLPVVLATFAAPALPPRKEPYGLIAFQVAAGVGITLTLASSVIVPLISSMNDLNGRAPVWAMPLAVWLAAFAAVGFLVFCARERPYWRPQPVGDRGAEGGAAGTRETQSAEVSPAQ